MSDSIINLRHVRMSRFERERWKEFLEEIKLRLTEDYYYWRLMDARGETPDTVMLMSDDETRDVRSQVQMEQPFFAEVVELVEQQVNPVTEASSKILEIACKAFELGIEACAYNIICETGRRPSHSSATGHPTRRRA